MKGFSFKEYLPLSWLVLLVASTFIVYCSAIGGRAFLATGKCTGHKFGYHNEWYANWDGQWYTRIAERGYQANYTVPTQMSPVVFLPLYPMLGSAVSAITGIKAEMSLLLVSLASLLGFTLLWHLYAHKRLGKNKGTAEWALAAVLLWPASYFLRMSYTESLFLMLLAALMLGFIKKWPEWVLVVIAALLSATRLNGVCGALAVACHIWLKHSKLPLRQRALRAAGAGALSLSGLAFYMIFLWARFGDPLLFLSAQAAWGAPFEATTENLLRVLTFQSVWEFFTSGRYLFPSAWPHYFLNWFSWAAITGLVFTGWYKRWLTAEEIVIGFFLIGLAYITCASPTRHSISLGRYAMLALPAYLVLGRLLALAGPATSAAVIAVMTVFLALFSGLFAQWYCMF